MSMTREEAIAEIKYYMEHDSYADAPSNEACQMAINALRPVSREQVEKVFGGKWEEETYTTLSGRGRVIHSIKNTCSACGKTNGRTKTNFCPSCGAPMTDEAVDILLKRLEALKDGKGI